MAELGAVASIIAVVQLAGVVTSLGYGYIGGVKRAPRDLQDLVDELSSLHKVLATLRDLVDEEGQLAALEKLNEPGGPLAECSRVLAELKARLEPKTGLKGAVNALRWPLEKQETMQYISRVERHKTLFVFALTADQMYIQANSCSSPLGLC